MTDIVFELDALASAISKAENEWEEVIYHGEGDKDHDEQYVSDLVREAYLMAATLLEKRGLPIVAQQVFSEIDSFSNNLIEEKFIKSIEEHRLITTRPLWRVVSVCRQLFSPMGKENSDPQYGNALKILRNLPLSLTRYGVNIEGESDLDTFAETLLKSLFPDLKSNPVVPLTNSYRQPDTEIPSIDSFIEYKYISSHKKKSLVIDEMQADIRNYASKGRGNLIFLIGQKKDYFVENKVRADLLVEPTSFGDLQTLVVRV